MAKIISGLFLLFLFNTAWAIVQVPALRHRVTDLTATLTPGQVTALEQKIAAFEAEKGSQIAVLLVPTTQEEDIAQFGIRVADAWKIGRQKIDDGVILIVAKNDRRMRIEVGYGLEGVIPDAVAKRIIAETIAPYFKQGNFAGGINAGVSRIMQLIKGEPLPPRQNAGQAVNAGMFMFILLGGIFAGFILSLTLGRFMGSVIAGVGSTLVASLFLSLGLSVFLGILIFILIVGGLNRGYRSGWYSGGFGGGSWGGGGGGSWSGGGGGFGGGGASGSW